jgi:hypothetical protein
MTGPPASYRQYSTMSTRTFYKLDIQGIVYLVDPTTGRAYTYDLENPTEIGTVTWTNPKAEPSLTLRSDWLTVLTRKFAATPITTTTTSTTDASALDS